MYIIHYLLKKVNAKFNFVMKYKVEYRGKNRYWIKARELDHQLVGKMKTVDLLSHFMQGKR